jgi:hypothetical protein
MSKFAIIAEGPTDQTVLENIILGYFQKAQEEPVVNFFQPPPPTAASPAPSAGWSLVFSSLRRDDAQTALQFNDYLMIHIDADVQEEVGFDVPRRGEDNKELPIPDRIKRIITKLTEQIDAAFFQANAHRIVFAVGVDSIECWLLLPRHVSCSQKNPRIAEKTGHFPRAFVSSLHAGVIPLLHEDKKAQKTTGCLGSANKALRKVNRKGLSSSSGDTKFVQAYEEASREYAKHKMLRRHCSRNPSFQVFITRLDDLFPTS